MWQHFLHDICNGELKNTYCIYIYNLYIYIIDWLDSPIRSYWITWPGFFVVAIEIIMCQGGAETSYWSQLRVSPRLKHLEPRSPNGHIPKDFYMYSAFTENPGNQCYLHSSKTLGLVDANWMVKHDGYAHFIARKVWNSSLVVIHHVQFTLILVHLDIRYLCICTRTCIRMATCEISVQ